MSACRRLVVLVILLGAGASDLEAANLQKSVEIFQKLDKNHMELVDEFYDRNVVFQDPVHELRGVSAVRRYYEGLYRNVDAIRFDISRQFEDRDTVVLVWRMYLRTPSLNSGRELAVDGTSVITFGDPEGKAIAHRDYFDMGQFVYEQVPVLRSIIGYIKRRLAGD